MQLLRLIDELRIGLRHPDPELRADPRHQHDAADRARRAGGPGLPVDRRHRGRQRSFGVDLALLREGARRGAVARPRGTVGDNVMYFETGQGSALSAGRRTTASTSRRSRPAPMRWRARFEPLLVNSVVGFIGPEYLYDGKQIIRAGLEDHFCGKLLGLPMGLDVCYTNHAEADQDDMDMLLTLAAPGRGELHHGRAGRRRRHAATTSPPASTTRSMCASCWACGPRRSSSPG